MYVRKKFLGQLVSAFLSIIAFELTWAFILNEISQVRISYAGISLFKLYTGILIFLMKLNIDLSADSISLHISALWEIPTL